MTARRGVLLFAALLFFWELGGHDLWAPDEPYFAEGAREMVVDGEWTVPHVNGKITTDKPPMFFWLIALFSLPLGEVSSLTARLPSALAALGTVALTMRLGTRFFGARSAALAGLILSTTYMFWDKARWSETDALLCLLIWIALSAFAAFRLGDADGRRAGLLFWLAAALAVLAKGPVGLLLPLGIAVVTLGADRDLRRWRDFAPWQGPLLFAAVLSAWIAAASLFGPAEYSVWGALKEHFVDRGIHGLHHKRPVWYYLEALPPQLLPWTGLIAGALVLGWRRRRLPAERFLFVTTLFVWIFFTISTEKRELYTLPAVPALALLMAALVAQACGWEEPPGEAGVRADRRWITIGQGFVGGLFVLLGVAVPLSVDRFEEIQTWMAWVLGAGLFVGGAGALYFAIRSRLLAASVAPALALGLMYLFAVTVVYPAFEPRKSGRAFALSVKETTAESRARGLPVVAYAVGNLPEAFAFYSDGVYLLETNDAAVLARELDRAEQVFAVVDIGELEQIDPELAKRLIVLDTTRLSRQDVLLVTNHRE